MTQSRKTGFLLVIAGTIFWGIGGTVAQKLFQQFDVDVTWLVVVRLLIAGVLLLLLHTLQQGPAQIKAVWTTKATAIRIIIFGLIGMLAVQYTYMASIHHGNAAVATLLQYIAPVFIIIYLVLRKQTHFSKNDFITILLALIGCFFLLTNGSLATLSVPMPAIIWGLLSAVALAFYTLYAVPLLKQFDAIVIVGWAMIIGGLGLSIVKQPWDANFTAFTIEAYLYLLFIIIFGTMLAFWFYVQSLKSLSAKETSLLGSLEPLSAVLATVFWLQVPFGMFQWIGTGCLLLMIAILAFSKK